MGQLEDFKGKIVAIDTSLFIYFIEENEDYLSYS